MPIDYKKHAEAMHKAIKLTIAEDALTNDAWHALNDVVQDYDIDHQPGPMPEWAESYNLDLKPVLRAQLCTKDGRRMGNARITQIETIGEKIYYHIRTDAGNEMHMSLSEINECFWIGMYILKEGE